MLTDEQISELNTVLRVQHALLHDLEHAAAVIAKPLSDAEGQTAEVRELGSLIAQLEEQSELLRAEDFGDYDPSEITAIYDERRQLVDEALVRIDFTDWPSFVRRCETEVVRRGMDSLAPYEALLTDEDRKQLRDESYAAQYRWDKWDYIFVGASGVLAALSDFLLVRIPKTMTYNGTKQAGSPLTEWITRYRTDDTSRSDWFARWTKELANSCQVPYDDPSLRGMGGKSHRLQSLGHDPVLGFIFGVLDIMRGTLTGFSYDRLVGQHIFTVKQVASDSASIGLSEAILRHIGHLISDVATPAGLPAPFLTIIQGLNVGHFGKKGRTVGEVARWMYLNGYDFRHFLVSGIAPAVIEIVLRAYIMLRHYAEHGEVKFSLAGNPKFRSMLLMAHSVAALANAGKVALMHGNPLAINEAEWLALIRYLIPSIKYWVFDKQRVRLEYTQRVSDRGWRELLVSGTKALELVFSDSLPAIALGTKSG